MGLSTGKPVNSYYIYNKGEKRPQIRSKGKTDGQIDNQINKSMCQKEFGQNIGVTDFL